MVTKVTKNMDHCI